VWEPFQFFVGAWRGTGEGHSGASLVERTYRWIAGQVGAAARR